MKSSKFISVSSESMMLRWTFKTRGSYSSSLTFFLAYSSFFYYYNLIFLLRPRSLLFLPSYNPTYFFISLPYYFVISCFFYPYLFSFLISLLYYFIWSYFLSPYRFFNLFPFIFALLFPFGFVLFLLFLSGFFGGESSPKRESIE